MGGWVADGAVKNACRWARLEATQGGGEGGCLVRGRPLEKETLEFLYRFPVVPFSLIPYYVLHPLSSPPLFSFTPLHVPFALRCMNGHGISETWRSFIVLLRFSSFPVSFCSRFLLSPLRITPLSYTFPLLSREDGPRKRNVEFLSCFHTFLPLFCFLSYLSLLLSPASFCFLPKVSRESGQSKKN